MTERTLYDSSGVPIAYIVNDGSIYLWTGEATTHLDGERLYGWNGKHLGVFRDGILYDLRGIRVGFEGRRCPAVLHVQPVKHVKHVKHVRSVKHVAHVSPVLSLSHRSGLRELLVSGR